jgi:hypothetical protein
MGIRTKRISETMTSSWDQISEVVLAFVNAQTWAERKQIIENHCDLLLTDAAHVELTHLLAQYRDNEDVTRILEEHRRLLLRCSREGIDAAFADLLGSPEETHQSELVTLLNELPHLTQASDMPRAIAVCRAALTLIDRDSQPELWAELHSKLGNRLFQNPLADRAENIEQAIYHYQLPLEVLTRQDFPVGWAAAQNALGNAFS